MAPRQAIPILGQMEDISVQVTHLWFPGGYNNWRRTPGLTSVMNNSDSGRIFASWHLFESDSNNGPSPGRSNLGQIEDTSA